MKLYEVPNKTKVRFIGEDMVDEVFFFDHIDGMYSYCLDKDKNVHHFAAWAEVEIVKSTQEIDSQPEPSAKTK